MKLILFVVCAMVMAAYAVEVISVDDLLRAYDVSHNKIGKWFKINYVFSMSAPFTFYSYGV